MKKNKYLLTSVLLFSTLGLAMTSVSCTNEKVEATYQIQCEENKDYILKTDVNKAKAKDVVTISVNITNIDKEIDQILINGSNEGVTTITKNSKYTFIMPNSDVTISATLTDKVYENKEITINEVNGFKTTFKVNNEVVTSAKKGDEVHVLLTNETDDRRVKSLTSNDVKIETITSGEEYKFIMIDNKVNLTLTDEAIPTHNLNFINEEGLSAKFYFKDKEVSEGIEGKEITIKLTLLEKYAFDSLVVNTPGVSLKTIKEGEEYTFIMPNTDVNIEGNAHKVIQKYSITKILAVAGISEITGITKDSKINEGEEVTFTFKFSNNKYSYGAYVNNQLIMASLEANDKVGTINFKMPSEDVEILVGPFEENDKEQDGSRIVTIELPEISSDYKIFGIKSGKYDLGDEYSYRTMRLYIVSKLGILIGKSNVTYTIGNSRPITLSYDTTNNYYNLPIYNAKAGDVVKINIESTKPGTKKINITNIDNVEIIGDYKECTIGSTVTIGVKAKDGYVLNNKNYPNYIIKSYELADGKTTGLTFEWTSSKLSFKMPDQDLSITFNLGVVTSLKYEENDKIESVKFYNSRYSSTPVTEANSGSDVYVEIKTKAGYKLTHVFVNNKNIEATHYSGYKYMFTIPEDAKEIKIICEVETLYSLTYEKDTKGYTISELESNYYSKGEKVTFSLYRKIGYTIDEVTLNDGTKVNKSSENAYEYSFLMPGVNVTLNVKVSEVKTSILTFDNSSKSIKKYAITDMYNNVVNSGDKVNVGEILNIEVTSSNGFSIENLSTSKGTITKVDNKHYTLTNPSEDFTIKPNYKEEEKFDITIENTHTEWYKVSSFKDNYETDISISKKGYTGHTITLQIESVDNNGIRYFKTATVTNLNTNEIVETKSNESSDDSLYVSFTMPNAPVSINFDIVEKVTRKLNKIGENADKFKIYDSSSTYNANEISTALANKTVYVRLNVTKLEYINSNEDFTLNYSYTLNGELVSSTYSFAYKTDYFRFTLPDADVTFSLTYTNKTDLYNVKVTQNEYSSKLIVSDSSSTYSAEDFGDDFNIAKGQKIYVIANISDEDLNLGTYTITIKNKDTNEDVKTFNITSSWSKYTYFNINSNIVITLTCVAK